MASSLDPRVVERGATDSGLTVVRQSPTPGSATFSSTFVAPAGSAFDPEGKESLAAVASRLVVSGAGSLDRVALARLLDRHGATLSSQCDPESAEITLWGPSSSFDPLMDVLALSVRAPRFDRADLERTRRQFAERQMREQQQPESRVERELFHAVFPPGHPYRESGSGTARSLRSITAGHLRRFHRQRWLAQRALLVVTTPRTLEECVRWAEQHLGFLDSEATFDPPHRVPAPRTQTESLEIPMRGRTQVELRIGGASLPRLIPEFPALFLANEVLGGRSLSRLFQRVRERHGLAYHASSTVESMRWGGYWWAQAGTGPERLNQVVRLIRKELKSIRQELVPSRELSRIRESAVGSIPLQLETTRGAHELAVEVAYFGLTPDFYRTWPKRLAQVRPRDIKEAAVVGLNSAHAVQVWAGPAPAHRERA